VGVQLRNGSDRTWRAWGPTPVHISYHLANASGETVVYDGRRTRLFRPVDPGEQLTQTATIQAPQAGTYRVRLAVVQEFVRWIECLGGRAR